MLRQLQFSNGTDIIEIGQGQESPFLLKKVEGLGYSSDIYTSKSVYQNGETYVGSDLKMRNILIELSIIKNPVQNRNKLYNVFRPRTEGTFYYIQGDLKRKANCYIESVDSNEVKGVQTVLISLICPDPFFYDLENTISYMATWEKKFYFPVPYGIKPVVFGLKNDQKVKNIVNYGNAVTPLIINFTNISSADVMNPKLTNITTQEFLEVKTTLHQGDTLVINTKTKRIEQNGKNIFNKRVRGSKFFMLEVGDNYFQFDAELNPDYLDVSLEYNSAYTGV